MSSLFARRLFVVAALALTATAVFAQDPAGEVVATYTLSDVAIADAQNANLPDSISNDRGILLSGIGSDLWRSADDDADTFWAITDRGPNGQIRVDDKNRRTFPIPEFTPHILQLQVAEDTITVLQAIPLVNGEGVPVTGLSNLDGHDEFPWDYNAQTELAFNQNGLDTEGLVRTSAGDFWVVDEYSPSIALINAQGQVVRRFVPEDLVYDSASYEIVNNLPALYSARRGNRGFEGLAISPDESTLFVVLQSPLRNPDAEIGDGSRQTRILAFDIASETPIAEYVYEIQISTEFGAENVPGEMKLSAVIALDADTLLVLERTDAIAKIFHVELADATNILGSAWDDAATAPSLEALTDLAASDVAPVAKSLVIDLSTLVGMPEKIEGMAVVDNDTIAVINDNDFQIGDFDADGNMISSGVPSQILIINLAQPLN